MTENTILLRRRLPKLVAPALIALMATGSAFGFGGHPLPPGPPFPPLIPQGLPAQPGDGGGVIDGAPAEDETQIPAILLKPEINDVIEPVFDGGGAVEPIAPPGTNSPNETPEPATLLMSLVGVGAVLWRRQRAVRK